MPRAGMIRIVSVAALVPVAALCASCSKEPPAEPVRVEVWYLGDFGGTDPLMSKTAPEAVLAE